MKTSKKIGLIAVSLLFVMASCQKTDDFNVNNVEGRYVGTLTSGLKSASGSTIDATADVAKTKNGEIEVHCYGGEMDTTFMLNYYENHDSLMVCMTGNDFEHAYGHMSGGIMSDQAKGQTEWQHHMSDEHKNGDQHYGGFNMNSHTFGYTFRMASGNVQFMGAKK
jgi:hypothetical protein